MSEGAQYELDLVCIGRTSVDLYAEQEGARLEDVQSFRKYVGGSATNIAVGTARLGVKSAMLTRVGNEHMGRFVRRTLAENGVDVSYVLFDPEHLTPYVLLAVRAIEDFSRILAYGNAADLAIREEDIAPDFIASSSEVLPVDLAANAQSFGAYVIRAKTVDELNDALAQAKDVDWTVVIHIPVDRYEGVPDYESFWDVPVAEVSEIDSVVAARKEYAEGKRAERRYL